MSKVVRLFLCTPTSLIVAENTLLSSAKKRDQKFLSELRSKHFLRILQNSLIIPKGPKFLYDLINLMVFSLKQVHTS